MAPEQKKNIIAVRIYKKTKGHWKYWKIIQFSDFKYFVENFITELLKKKYQYKIFDGFYPAKGFSLRQNMQSKQAEGAT